MSSNHRAQSKYNRGQENGLAVQKPTGAVPVGNPFDEDDDDILREYQGPYKASQPSPFGEDDNTDLIESQGPYISHKQQNLRGSQNGVGHRPSPRINTDSQQRYTYDHSMQISALWSPTSAAYPNQFPTVTDIHPEGVKGKPSEYPPQLPHNAPMMMGFNLKVANLGEIGTDRGNVGCNNMIRVHNHFTSYYASSSPASNTSRLDAPGGRPPRSQMTPY
jgi:hypothetical protein